MITRDNDFSPERRLASARASRTAGLSTMVAAAAIFLSGAGLRATWPALAVFGFVMGVLALVVGGVRLRSAIVEFRSLAGALTEQH